MSGEVVEGTYLTLASEMALSLSALPGMSAARIEIQSPGDLRMVSVP